MTWQETYESECRVFKHELTYLTHILRYDPKQIGIEHIQDICRRLAAHSFQAGQVLKAANAMFEEDQNCKYVRRGPPGWFVGDIEDSEMEIHCSMLEYQLCKKAQQFREDHSLDLMITADLAILIKNFEKDVGV
ncbi:hypothetical protein N7508_003054 [Penicillium antarcticum]|uniref:uncharacterized protein n=1 Tax=Penicillium antarcticum TaxID=416450 RepID=UPI0023857550|nr:uncharacterized protein N7508_003054 [Penicillium antarcticum]KAJ5312224.1 hypothetical protein N7508_003054 [Penicillium antarcticum]